ncbi:MAG TPA: hypothetical protein VMY39_01790 [Planctomycetota bacterium]|nr:hypothetical protein [Planctomycetota bacterium]
MNRELAEELAHIYADLDAEIARRGWQCRSCGACCDFGKYGHMLYCSELEAEYLIGDRLPSGSCDDGVCPFLEDGRCTRRAQRAIGCRVYQCEGADRETLSQLSEEYVGRLKALHDRFGLTWQYRWVAEHVLRRKALSDKE